MSAVPDGRTTTRRDRRPTAARTEVFLGMAAGVGKTYRMLLEGQAEAEAGATS